MTAGSFATANAALADGAAITGTATDASNGNAALTGVTVDVFDTSGNRIASQTTDTQGNFAIPGVPASRYAVCFDPSTETGGAAKGGYAAQCYQGASWAAGVAPPAAGSTILSLSAGQAVSGINAGLTGAGSISGTVTTNSGAALGGVSVEAFGPDGTLVQQVATSSAGTFTINGLSPSMSYIVCYDPAQAFGSGSTKYAGQCSGTVPWIGGGPPPAGATRITPSASGSKTVKAQLSPAGSISGVVTASGGPRPDRGPGARHRLRR